MKQSPRFQYKVTEWSRARVNTIEEHLNWGAGEGEADWHLVQVIHLPGQHADQTTVSCIWERDTRKPLREY